MWMDNGILSWKRYPQGHGACVQPVQIVAPWKSDSIYRSHCITIHLDDILVGTKLWVEFVNVTIGLIIKNIWFCDVECVMFVPQVNLVQCRRRVKLGHVPVGAPLVKSVVDIMGPLLKRDNDNEYLLLLGNYFTKSAESFLLKIVLLKPWLMSWSWGLCDTLWVAQKFLLWQGSGFESQLTAVLCKKTRIKYSFIYDPITKYIVCNECLHLWKAFSNTRIIERWCLIFVVYCRHKLIKSVMNFN